MQPLVQWCHRHNLVAKFLLLVSVAGFSFQVSQVSHIYFKYETVTQVQQAPRQLIRPGNINFCPRFIDILDRERVFNETGIRLRRIHNDSDAYDMEGLLTVAQVYNYTPDEKTVVSECRLRDANNRIVTHSGKDCNDRLNVTKFVTQEYVCYLIMLKDRREVPVTDITTSSIGQYVVSVFLMSEAFATAEFGLAVMSKNTVPTTSRHYSRTVSIRNLTTGEVKANSVEMRFTILASYRLEKPYDTACINVSYKTPIFCVKDCLIHKYAAIERIPGEELLLKPYPVRPLSQRDLANQTIAALTRSAKEDCKHRCALIPCRVSYGFTTLIASRDENHVMRLSELTPAGPDLKTVSQPTMQFIEYFSFLSSYFGIWFGVSFLSLNPASVRRFLGKHFGRRGGRCSKRRRPRRTVSVTGGTRLRTSAFDRRETISDLLVDQPGILHSWRTHTSSYSRHTGSVAAAGAHLSRRQQQPRRRDLMPRVA